MNCKNCSEILDSNVLVCPKCGFDNSINQPIDALDEEVVVNQIDVNAAPEELNFASEDLTSKSMDITAASNVDTYDSSITFKTEESQVNSTIQDEIDIAIPSVVEPTIDDKVNADNVSNVALDNITDKDLKKSKFKFSSLLGKKISFVAFIIGIIAFLGVGYLIGSSLSSGNYVRPVSTTTYTGFKTVADGHNNITTLGEYVFKIPESYQYDKKNNGLFIYSNDDTWRIYIRPQKDSYQDVSSSKTSLKESLKLQGLTIGNIIETKVNERAFLCIETTLNATNRLIAVTKYDDSNLFYLEIVTYDNNYLYDVLSLIDDLIKNAEINEKVSNMEGISVYDVYDIINSVGQNYKVKVINAN